MSAEDPQEQARRARAGAALFRPTDRSIVEVRGADRTRWLNGMVSNDVAALAAGPERSGCYAALLTPKGRIVSDLHILLREDSLWLETDAAAAPRVIERLERYIVADDVVLEDVSSSWARLGLEGPAAPAILAAASDGGNARLAPESCAELTIGGRAALAAAFGWSGEAAFQLIVAPEDADPVAAALRAAAEGWELPEAGPEALEILRVEAGLPRFAAELDEEVLPDEARLERAISTTKGCYTGQEIVARLRSRGAVNHLLVGLAFEGALPPVGQKLEADDRPGRPVGEVTSVASSSTAGSIGLGFVRREYAEASTPLRAGSVPVRVAALPFVPPATPVDDH